MGLFDKLSGPVIYKDSVDAGEQLVALKELCDKVDGDKKKLIEQDIRLLEYGIKGEDNVEFELSNSFIPILILKDLKLQYDELTAQIDFLVITRKCIFVIECKNMFGDIEVNKNGDFIRTTVYEGRKKREGIYSPVTQNRRHLDVLKAIRKNDKGNVLLKMMFEKYFDENYKSIIVLANPKTVLDVSKAERRISDQIIRSDRLISYIKEINSKSKLDPNSDKHMYELAETFLGHHKPAITDYTSRYLDNSASYTAEKDVSSHACDESANDGDLGPSSEESPLYTELKSYRLKKSREENVKAYFIFTNAQLDELIVKMPDSLESLKSIPGFGEVKSDKYGQELMAILNRYRK